MTGGKRPGGIDGGGRRRFLAWNILTAAIVILRRLPFLPGDRRRGKAASGREALFYRKLD